MESTPVVSIQAVSVRDVFAMFRTFSDFTGIYTWKYQWKAMAEKRQKLFVVLLMFHSCFNIALQLFNFVRLLFVISWNKLATGTEMVKVTYCVTYLFTLGMNVVCISSARNNWDLLIQKLHEVKGTVGRRLVKLYKFLLGIAVVLAAGHSAYIYTSLSRVKSGDDIDILTMCRMAPVTPDMFIWNILTLMYVFMNMFMITRVVYLLTVYFLAAYHIVQEFNLLKNKVTDLEQPGRHATSSIIKELRLQYEYPLSLTNMLDLLLTLPTFLGYSSFLPNIFVFIYVLLRVPLTTEEVPSVIEILVMAFIYIAILTLAGTYINTASKGTEDALYQIGINWTDGRTSRAYQTFLFRVSTSDVGITALGFFTISKGTVLTMVGTIVSYVIVILQFPTSSDSIQVRPNATLYP